MLPQCSGDALEVSHRLPGALDHELVATLLQLDQSQPRAPRLAFAYDSDFHEVNSLRAASRSNSACRLIQNWAELPKWLASRSAVSAVMRRLPRMISLTRCGCTPSSRSSAFWLRPLGFKNCSNRTLPGWGLRCFFIL